MSATGMAKKIHNTAEAAMYRIKPTIAVMTA